MCFSLSLSWQKSMAYMNSWVTSLVGEGQGVPRGEGGGRREGAKEGRVWG